MSTQPKEKSILFKGPMVRAIIEGRKDVTRRIAKRNHNGHVCKGSKCWHVDDPNAIKACPYGLPGERLWVKETHGFHGCMSCYGDSGKNTIDIRYHADGTQRNIPFGSFDLMMKNSPKQNLKFPKGYDDMEPDEQMEVKGDLIKSWWNKKKTIPSIFMKRAYSRILLENVSIRIERLHDITEEDAKREGITELEAGCLECGECHEKQERCDNYSPSYRDGYVNLWEEINGEGSWLLNPWVWRIEFKVIEIKGKP